MLKILLSISNSSFCRGLSLYKVAPPTMHEIAHCILGFFFHSTIYAWNGALHSGIFFSDFTRTELNSAVCKWKVSKLHYSDIYIYLYFTDSLHIKLLDYSQRLSTDISCSDVILRKIVHTFNAQNQRVVRHPWVIPPKSLISFVKNQQAAQNSTRQHEGWKSTWSERHARARQRVCS